ncbi:unnamed protein product [Caenorhabditis sp. 36 PRJEB53466]|nr:unnamed protein product [Caenorhabditis sp. 36 PRJEB53466]
MSDNHAFGRPIPEDDRLVVETMRTESAAISNNFNAVNRSNKSDVQHLQELSLCLGELFTSAEHSDVTLVFDDGSEIAAHRLILAVRSSFFRAMLFNGFQESHQPKVNLKDTNSTAFRAILQYMYTSKIDFTGVELDILLEYLSLAHRYDLGPLMTAISENFKEILRNENLCSIFNAAYFFQLSDLIEYCMQYSDKYADQLLDDPSFNRLTGDSLKELLARDSFCANELKIFNAVRTWYKHNPTMKDALKLLLELVRLPLISQNELLNFVRPTGLVKADDLLDAIAIQAQKPQEIAFRGCKSLDTNIIPQYPNVQPLSREHARRYTSDENVSVFHVDLSKPFIINTILMELNWKTDVHGFSYEIHVSMENRTDGHWTLVANYSDYDCRGMQRVFFEDTVVRYILIKCTDRMATRLEASRIEAMYSSETMPVDPVTKIMVPDRNIATVLRHARVLEGVSRCRNALINGDITTYDWDSGYTCHQIGSGHIMVQLAQPYIISSMRILLWNCDDRFYSYYVTVSTNQQAEDNFQRATKRRRTEGGVALSPTRSRKFRCDEPNKPKLDLRLSRLTDGQRIDCEHLASFIHFATFGSMLQKPKWVSISHHRNLLQTLVIRINVEDDFFETTNLTFPSLFFDKRWIEMDTDISDRNLFWNCIMNVRLTLKEQIRRKSEKMQKTYDELGKHDKSHFLLSTEQMAMRSYPFPGEAEIVPTKQRYRKLTHSSPLFSLDCEMCETTVQNRALTRISIIDEQENTVLDTLVKPEGRITDYVTRYSGITSDMMEGVTTTLEDVQKAVQSLLPPDAILVGHSLEHDLQAMKMTHPYCLDVGHALNYTSNNSGLRNSLKNLTELFLGEEIQSAFGHCSYEDAWAAMRLAQLKLEKGIVFGNTCYGWQYTEYAKTNNASVGRRIQKETVSSVPCSDCSQPTVVGCSVQNCRCRFVSGPSKCVRCVKEAESIEGDFDWKESLPVDSDKTTSPLETYLKKDKMKSIMCAFDRNGINVHPSTSKKIRSKLAQSFPNYGRFLDNVASEMLNDSLVLVEIDKEKVEPLEDGSAEKEEQGEAVDNAETLNRTVEKLVGATAKNALVMMIFSSSKRNILYVRVK